jgi:hypothetical protein
MDKMISRTVCFSVIACVQDVHEAALTQCPEEVLEGLDLARRALLAVYGAQHEEAEMGVSIPEPKVVEPTPAPVLANVPLPTLPTAPVAMKFYDPVLKAHKAKLAKSLKANFAWDFDNKEHQEMATQISDMLKEMFVTIEDEEIFLAEVQSCVAKVQAKKAPAGAPF